MASVIGLAPIRPGLKDRLRELFCIDGRKWSPRFVSRQRLLVFSEALICLELLGELVVRRGNAPRSSAYHHDHHAKLAPADGFAPPTFRLTAGGSTVELRGM